MPDPDRPPQPRALVLGGGLAGMAAAVRLQEAGHAVTLLEARSTLGGRAGSIPINALADAADAPREAAAGTIRSEQHRAASIPASPDEAEANVAPRGTKANNDDDDGDDDAVAELTPPELIDQAQHVLLGCCTNLIDFYRRLGVLDQIEWHDDFPIVDPRGRLHVLRRSTSPLVPAPLQFALSGLRFRGVRPLQRLVILRGLISLIRSDRTGPVASGRNRHETHGSPSGTSFGDWLRQHEQAEQVVQNFWNPVIESACNAHVNEVDEATGRQVFIEGVLRHPRAARLGLARCPLADLYAPARQRIAAVRTGERVARVERDAASGCFEVHTRAGHRHHAETVVFALPVVQAGAVLGPTLRPVLEVLAPLIAGLRFGPILNVHLFFDRPLLPTDKAVHPVALMDRPVHWFFLRQGGRHVHAVVSAAHALVNQPRESIEHLVLTELDRAMNAIRRRGGRAPADNLNLHENSSIASRRGLTGLHSIRIIRERRATFIPSAATMRIRPEPSTPVPGFFLAGDWCRTGWPATMEGAIRSGYRAAAAALQRPDTALLAPDLPPGRLYGLLAGGFGPADGSIER